MKPLRDIRQFYSMPKSTLTKEDGHRLNRLIQLHLRLALLEAVFWERSPEPKGGLFTDVMDLHDEADGIMATLQLFGFLPQEDDSSADRLARAVEAYKKWQKLEEETSGKLIYEIPELQELRKALMGEKDD